MGLRSVRRLACAALCGVLCMTTGCDAVTGGGGTFSPVRGSVIAVLGQSPPRVALLDADTLEVQRTVRLRSQSIGMAGVSDTVVTAQCGELGERSDTKLGVIRPAAGSLDYCDLGLLDPEEVWSTDEGWCLVLHGLIDGDGMKCSRVDVSTGVSEALSIPPAGQAGAGASSTVWLLQQSVSGSDDRVTERFYVFGAEGPPRVIASETTRTVDICGFDDAVVTATVAADGVRLVRRDAVTGAVLADRTIAGIVPGPGCAWAAGDVLVLADQRAGEGSEVRSVFVLDPETLALRFKTPVDGMGAAGSAGAGRFVICEADGDVIVYDCASGEMVAGTTLDGRAGELLEVAFVGSPAVASD